MCACKCNEEVHATECLKEGKVCMRLDEQFSNRGTCILIFRSVYACPFVAISILLNFVQFKTSHLLNLK